MVLYHGHFAYYCFYMCATNMRLHVLNVFMFQMLQLSHLKDVLTNMSCDLRASLDSVL